jgi:aldehyde dehydrogenase (NAD+)
MRDYTKFYIDGAWVAPAEARTLDVLNPATEAVAGHISMGSAADVNRAVAAAKKAFTSFSRTTRAERLELLGRIIAVYQKRMGEMGAAITEVMGACVAGQRIAGVPGADAPAGGPGRAGQL